MLNVLKRLSHFPGEAAGSLVENLCQLVQPNDPDRIFEFIQVGLEQRRLFYAFQSYKISDHLKHKLVSLLAMVLIQTDIYGQTTLNLCLERIYHHLEQPSESKILENRYILSAFSEAVSSESLSTLTRDAILDFVYSLLTLPAAEKLLHEIIILLKSLSDMNDLSFSTKFTPIMELLMGWHLEENISKNTCLKITEFVSSLWSYWYNDYQYRIDVIHSLTTQLATLQDVSIPIHLHDAFILDAVPIKSLKPKAFRLQSLITALFMAFEMVNSMDPEAMSIMKHLESPFSTFLFVLINVARTCRSQTWIDACMDNIEPLLIKTAPTFTSLKSVQAMIAVRFLPMFAASKIHKEQKSVAQLIDSVSRSLDPWMTNTNLLNVLIHPKDSFLMNQLRCTFISEPKILKKLWNMVKHGLKNILTDHVTDEKHLKLQIIVRFIQNTIIQRSNLNDADMELTSFDLEILCESFKYLRNCEDLYDFSQHLFIKMKDLDMKQDWQYQILGSVLRLVYKCHRRLDFPTLDDAKDNIHSLFENIDLSTMHSEMASAYILWAEECFRYMAELSTIPPSPRFLHLVIDQFEPPMIQFVIKKCFDLNDAVRQEAAMNILPFISLMEFLDIPSNESVSLKNIEFTEEMFVNTAIAMGLGPCLCNPDESAVSLDDVIQMCLLDYVDYQTPARQVILWVMQASARFCVNRKLKTPLGAPQEFLQAMEDVLMQSMTKAKQNPDSNSSLRLLVRFIDTLEQVIDHTLYGSDLTLPMVEKPVLIFFSANKKICLDWFAKIRRPLVTAAMLIDGCEDVMFRNGSQVLRDALSFYDKTSFLSAEVRKELLSVGFGLAQFSLQTGAIDTLTGFRKSFSRLGPEFKALFSVFDCLAKGELEECYQIIRQPNIPYRLAGQLLDFLLEQTSLANYFENIDSDSFSHLRQWSLESQENTEICLDIQKEHVLQEKLSDRKSIFRHYHVRSMSMGLDRLRLLPLKQRFLFHRDPFFQPKSAFLKRAKFIELALASECVKDSEPHRIIHMEILNRFCGESPQIQTLIKKEVNLDFCTNTAFPYWRFSETKMDVGAHLNDRLGKLSIETFNDQLTETLSPDMHSEFWFSAAQSFSSQFDSHLQGLKESLSGQNTASWDQPDSNPLATEVPHFAKPIQTTLADLAPLIFKSYIQSLQWNTCASKIHIATAQVINFLCRLGPSVDGSILEMLSTVPTYAWKPFIKSLFSRLRHKDPQVRDTLVRIIESLQDDPHVLHYLAAGPIDSKDNALLLLYKRLSDSYSTISVMKKVNSEFKRISVLWEERWAITLTHLNNSVVKAIAQLEDMKSSKIITSIHLPGIVQRMANFIEAQLSPILQLTCASAAETPDEAEFQNKYQKKLQAAFEKLQGCCDLILLKQTWAIFQEFCKSICKSLSKIRHPALGQISPILESMEWQNYPLLTKQGAVTVSRVSKDVAIIPTKTKPKKIEFLRDDGSLARYLIKGLEDLRVDATISSFFALFDQVQNSSHLRTYMIQPLDNQLGLIEWVDQVVSVFATYRRAKQFIRTNDGKETDLWKPVLEYQSTLKEVCKKKHLSVPKSHRNIPVDVSLEVYSKLISQHPADVLSKSMWHACLSPMELFCNRIRYSQSLGCSAMVGYVLGLGDRHLDNILIDFATGELVHIDFNVSFEKGKRLRVPETVPFRLTRNFFHALGPTGTEGVFQSTAERTLKILKERSSVFMTVLEDIYFEPIFEREHAAFPSPSSIYASLKISFYYEQLGELIQYLESLEGHSRANKVADRLKKRLVSSADVLRNLIAEFVAIEHGSAQEMTLIWKNIEEKISSKQKVDLDKLFLEARDLMSLLKQSHSHLESTVKFSDMDNLIDDFNKATLSDEEVMDNQVITESKMNAMFIIQQVKAKIKAIDQTEAMVWKLVEEATSTHHLARMYEGWTSWI